MELKEAAVSIEDRSQAAEVVQSCRIPGRVTLLGEHLDYNGLPVLAMPINRGMSVAFGIRNDSKVHLTSSDPAFGPLSFENSAGQAPVLEENWGRYVHAVVSCLNRELRVRKAPGFSFQVQSDLPAAAGLASSSALTVAAGLAYLAVLGMQLDEDVARADLAQWLAEAERETGTQGGAMDHAALLLGVKGFASKIDFLPLRAESAPLPPGYRFLISHSLVPAEKGGAAQGRYNEGPRIGRILCRFLERQLQEEFEDPDLELDCLGDLWFGPLCLSLAEVEELCQRALQQECYTSAEIVAHLQLKKAAAAPLLAGLQEPAAGFPLRARLRHQISEFRRVEAGRDALLAQDAAAFGELMNASHRSCAHDCGVSCPELDELTTLAREAGAIGSRLTGAGLGGAVLSLAPEAALEAVQAHLSRRYYCTRIPADQAPPLFVVEPGGPACYV